MSVNCYAVREVQNCFSRNKRLTCVIPLLFLYHISLSFNSACLDISSSLVIGYDNPF